MKTVSVAIDGPSGAGKSTIAKTVAKRLGFTYIDTGAMYRTVALYALENGIDTKNADGALEQALAEIGIDISYEDGSQHIFLNGRDVSEQIRTPQVSMGASDVAAVPAVRLKLVELQRALANRQNVIMDGRDIGTYVLPDADIKIFLTADVEDRARRRYEELVQKGNSVRFADVLEDMKQRDKNDSARAFAPLCRAEDAELIDTTGASLDESVGRILSFIQMRLSMLG
ncbi:MAG TPA: (d)CMP kinase [Candidatus Aphodoplasma excrementigallinarum]|uniref:Cytidylate kinase n=1 Tax=Candidatus Aphodoplasma excrementigallinarum TaxID=2840673 RepID=A0A9D1SZV0_9FIRM|nr:(d)CMP kinase [Candidatus Aphodoplasma excrementigallinarum]